MESVAGARRTYAESIRSPRTALASAVSREVETEAPMSGVGGVDENAFGGDAQLQLVAQSHGRARANVQHHPSGHGHVDHRIPTAILDIGHAAWNRIDSPFRTDRDVVGPDRRTQPTAVRRLPQRSCE